LTTPAGLAQQRVLVGATTSPRLCRRGRAGSPPLLATSRRAVPCRAKRLSAPRVAAPAIGRARTSLKVTTPSFGFARSAANFSALRRARTASQSCSATKAAPATPMRTK
jgi:hypothetical protein